MVGEAGAAKPAASPRLQSSTNMPDPMLLCYLQSSESFVLGLDFLLSPLPGQTPGISLCWKAGLVPGLLSCGCYWLTFQVLFCFKQDLEGGSWLKPLTRFPKVWLSHFGLTAKQGQGLGCPGFEMIQ